MTIDFFNHLLETRNHHAFLFAGEREVLIKNLFSSLKIFWSTENPLNHPDLVYMTTDQLSADGARLLKARSSQKSLSGLGNIFVLNVGWLGIEAQNILLKTFEEPAEDSIFCLITDNPDQLLPTIRSRFLNYDFRHAQSGMGADFWCSLPAKRLAWAKQWLGADEVFSRSSLATFLNQLEISLVEQIAIPANFAKLKTSFVPINQVRTWLDWPTASPKLLWEYLALTLPVLDGVPEKKSKD